jgi:tetratricopeptide (TPR) repeat protein
MRSSSSKIRISGRLKQALLRHEQGRLREALALYQQVLALDPDSFEALHGAGILYGQLGLFEHALQFITRASIVKPKVFFVYYNQGKAFQELKRHNEALASYDKALALKSDYVPASINRGNVLKELHRYEEALASYDKVLSLRPDFLEAYLNRGLVLQNMQRYEEALSSYDKAIARNPNYAEAHYGRGNALKNLERYEAALAEYGEAINLKPDYAEAYNNRGSVLNNLQRHDEAMACYDKATTLWPDYADANFNKALLKLLLGDYELGWLLHEWRWDTDQYKDLVRHFKQPLWLGEQSPAGQTILLYADHGLGDAIQVARYVPMVAALGATVILEVPSPLVALFSTLQGVTAVIARGDALPEFELQCPLMSLPLAFKTKISTIPVHVPYLEVDTQKERVWRERLGPKVRSRVGLTWSGNARHKNDRNRSISLRGMQPLLCSDFEYHAVQKEIRHEDQTTLAEFNVIQSHEGALHDLSDTAALISELDLIITVDTSVAHLAGALGKEVWVLLPYVPDYRWMVGRSDSPWYPTARLFRQGGRGDWENVIDQVRSKLGSDLALRSESN